MSNFLDIDTFRSALEVSKNRLFSARDMISGVSSDSYHLLQKEFDMLPVPIIMNNGVLTFPCLPDVIEDPLAYLLHMNNGCVFHLGVLKNGSFIPLSVNYNWSNINKLVEEIDLVMSSTRFYFNVVGWIPLDDPRIAFDFYLDVESLSVLRVNRIRLVKDNTSTVFSRFQDLEEQLKFMLMKTDSIVSSIEKHYNFLTKFEGMEYSQDLMNC